MDFLRSAVLVAVAGSCLFLSGCGTYRPVASILPLAPGNPQLTDTVAVYNVNPSAIVDPTNVTGTVSVFNVAGDSNVGNYQVGVNSTLAPTPQVPLTSRLVTFAASDTLIAAADTQADTVTLINPLLGTTQTTTLPAEFVPASITATVNTGLILVSLQPSPTATSFPTCGGEGAIGVVSAGTATLQETICAGSSPGFVQVMQGDTVAFILDQKDATNNLSVLNLATLSPASTISPVGTVGTNPIWAATSIDGSTLYVLNQGSNNISVVDAVNQAVNPTPITTGALSAPSVIITDFSSNRLYISNTGSNTVSILDASSSTLPVLLNSVSVGTAPVGLAVTPDGLTVYVANTGSNFASVISANSFVVTKLTPSFATVTLASNPNVATQVVDSTARIQAVAVSKDGTKAFIAQTTSTDVQQTVNTTSGSFTYSGNGTYVVLTSTNAFVTNASGSQINLAPPQNLLCDAANTCAGALLQRPVQIVPRM